jgi:adenylate kinase
LDDALRHIDNGNRVVLDGYPRNPAQAVWLGQHLPRHNRKIRAVIVFETPQEELVKRLAGRGRTEDTPAVIQRRLDIYSRNTKPVLDYYREREVPIVEIDGLGTVHEVHERIQQAVEECLLV